MKIKLIDINPNLTEAWNQVFKNIDEFSIVNDSIFNHPSDALVSPANSFGHMNGGIDFSISKNLGWHIEKELQAKIRNEYFGELLVGQATSVPTRHADFPTLIAAPTMRTPMTILRSPNVYLAMKAILLFLQQNSNTIKSVAIPGLGSGIGQVPPKLCANQMRMAWEDVNLKKYNSEKGWGELRSNYAYFYTHDDRDLKYDFS